MATVKFAIQSYIELLRPLQWLKNIFLFVALVFAKKALDPDAVLMVLKAFLIFCGLSSAMYIFNDLVDVKEDRAHPRKRNRPIAAGSISRQSAGLISAILTVLTVWASFELHIRFGIVAGLYLVLTILYTIWLKRIVLLDVLVIAMNYVIRVLGGAVVINAPITSWLVIVSVLVALFLALGKRRSELALLGEDAEQHRVIFRKYSLFFLDQLISIVTAALIVVYSLYTVDQKIVEALRTPWLPFTIPLVLYGLFRYLYLLYQKNIGGSPTEDILKDPPLVFAVLLWGGIIVVFVYLLSAV